MTKIFLFIFIAYGGEQYAMDVGQFDDEIACRITMEEVFDDLQAEGSRAPISCKLASYREALAWVREWWTDTAGDQLTPVVIVCNGDVVEGWSHG